MIASAILSEWLECLEFQRISDDEYRRVLDGDLDISINTAEGVINYPREITIADRTTSNLSQLENLVVLDCVIRLLEDNYPPSSITLEPRWKLGHGASGGRADILVRDRLGAAYLLIECKTAGREYLDAWEKTKNGNGQLFSYAQQETDVKFLALYASEPMDGVVVPQYQIISHLDDEVILSQADDLPSYRAAKSVEDRHRAWTTTYGQFSSSSGLFSGRRTPYQVGKTPRTTSDLVDLTETDRTRKSGEFATILRKYNISGRENAFDVLVNLFLAKLTDELDNPNNLQFTWRGSTVETPYELVERLEILYRTGMKKFLDEDVAYIASDDLDQAMRFIKSTPDAAKIEIAELFKRQKFYSRSNFGFLDVHNEELFLLNSAVLIEMVDMWQASRLSVAGNRASTQALGDMFEIFLDEGIKQNEGQYFTPWPICDFMIDCIPQPRTEEEYPRVLDFACGAGHFITQYYNKRIAPLSDTSDQSRAASKLFGVEKEYRLSKISKVASAMYGALDSNIYYQDALARSTFTEGELSTKFDILLSNPPYSVDGFLTQLDGASRETLDIVSVVNNPAKFDQIEDAFLQRAVEVVAPGGYAALIFPESFYDRESPSSNLTRETLFSYFQLKGLVKLPSGTFSSTGTSTWISFLRKREEGPSDVEQITARVAAIFAQGLEAIDDPTYDDSWVIDSYIEKFDLTKDAFLALINRDRGFSFENEVAFRDALNEKIAVQRNKRSNRNSKEVYDAALTEFFDELNAEHMDRLTKFWLLKTNGDCLIVTPDDTKGTKREVTNSYLGYKWSKRRGHAGLHLLDSEIARHSAPLFPIEGNSLAAAIRSSLSSLEDPEWDLEALEKDFQGRADFDIRSGVDIVSWPSQDSPLSVDLVPVIDISANSIYEVAPIGEVLNVQYGRGLPESSRNVEGDVAVFGSSGPVGTHDEALYTEPGIILGRKGSAGFASLSLQPSFPIDTTYFVRPKNEEELLVEFVYLVLDHHKFPTGGSGVPSLPKTRLNRYQIPTPPIDKQREIVENIFAREGSDRTDAQSVEQHKDVAYRAEYLTEELGW